MQIVTLAPSVALAFAGYLPHEAREAGLSYAETLALAAIEARDLGARVVVTLADAVAAGCRRRVADAAAFAARIGALFRAPASRRRARVDAVGYKSGRSKAGNGVLPAPVRRVNGYVPACGLRVAGATWVHERPVDTAILMPARIVAGEREIRGG